MSKGCRLEVLAGAVRLMPEGRSAPRRTLAGLVLERLITIHPSEPGVNSIQGDLFTTYIFQLFRIGAVLTGLGLVGSA